MRRFSQRTHLVTLSEINITPLLDLAFVLLIIFVITTPLLEKSIDLKLPTGGKPDRPVNKSDIRTVEVTLNGTYALDKRRVQLAELNSRLATDYRSNTNLVVYIRADENVPYKHVTAIIDTCQRSGITRYSLRTEPEKSR